jgi:hypothetical protein
MVAAEVVTDQPSDTTSDAAVTHVHAAHQQLGRPIVLV